MPETSSETLFAADFVWPEGGLVFVQPSDRFQPFWLSKVYE